MVIISGWYRPVPFLVFEAGLKLALTWPVIGFPGIPTYIPAHKRGDG